MCRCGYPGCDLIPRRAHWCTVCNLPHYTALEAEDCCDKDVVADD